MKLDEFIRRTRSRYAAAGGVLLLAIAGATCIGVAITSPQARGPVVPSPTSTAPSQEPERTVIAVLASDPPLSTASPAPWLGTLSNDLNARVIYDNDIDGGYLRSDLQGSDTPTFGEAAQQVPADASVVVMFGAVNDAEQPASSLRTSMRRAISRVNDIAPEAHVLIVGPVWPGANPPVEVTNLAQVMRSAARAAGADWADPVGSRWLSDSKLLRPSGTVLTAAGEKRLADRLLSAIRGATRS